MNILDYLAKYTVPFKGLNDGVHEFEFTIDEKFFEHFQGAEDYKGELEVKVVLEKKTLVMPLEISLRGKVNVNCDRCLDRFDLPVEGTTSLFIKFGEEREELAEDVIVVPEEENEIQLAQYIYELFSLSLPLKIVHPDDEDGFSTCNEEMIQKIDEFSVKEEEKIDPRWNELRKLIDNN
ncbi:MAG: DUF177 domain-containing protein [Marinifilaceae bacterium]